MNGSGAVAAREDALNPDGSERTAVSGRGFAGAENATSSITLHSVSKLRLPLGIRAYLGSYAGVYSWK